MKLQIVLSIVVVGLAIFLASGIFVPDIVLQLNPLNFLYSSVDSFFIWISMENPIFLYILVLCLVSSLLLLWRFHGARMRDRDMYW